MKELKKYNFKPYDQGIQMLIPPSWEDYIPETHIVRFVDKIIEGINLERLLKSYKNENGRSSYNPKMLLKLLIYGYLNNKYSSRQLEAFCIEDICCAWLTAMSKPDHNTISRFRSERLKGNIKEIFIEVAMLLIESGYVRLEEIYVDGTKIEANASKYKFVWGKSTRAQKEKTKQKLEELLAYAEQVYKKELKEKNEIRIEKMDSKKFEEIVEKINTKIEKECSEKEAKKIKRESRNLLEKYKEYEEKEKILGSRNSYSKTDKDATYMRMKDYSSPNGYSRAAYNLQISSNNQGILDYNLFQTSADMTTLPKQIESYKKIYGTYPEVITADAGYGSEENYEKLEKENIEGYVKYNNYELEKNENEERKTKETQFRYDEEKGSYCCLAGRKLEYVEEKTRKTSTGYIQKIKMHQLPDCTGCKFAGKCDKPKGQDQIEINEKGRKYRAKARDLLATPKGKAYMKKRPWHVEPVFGDVKYNNKFTRFLLRGLDKVNIEMGLVCIVHNIKKLFGFQKYQIA